MKLIDCEEASKSRYHIIVGSFKTASYADEYSAQVKGEGYDGKILNGPYGFSLVTANSHETLRSALNVLYEIRENVFDAWIYIE